MAGLKPKNILIRFIYNSIGVLLLLLLNYYFSQKNGTHLNMAVVFIVGEVAALVFAFIYEGKKEKNEKSDVGFFI
ncbi:hypothetical protein [Anaerostipes caccae]|uniref:hypothetical protein n=1 Tax=Anaerostipes caccae TaxID=105841 RepID=UPI0038D3E413